MSPPQILESDPGIGLYSYKAPFIFAIKNKSLVINDLILEIWQRIKGSVFFSFFNIFKEGKI